MSKNRFETKALHLARRNNLDQVSDSYALRSFGFQQFVHSDQGLESSYDPDLKVKLPFANQDLIHKFCEIENTDDGILCSSGNLAIYQTILGLTKTGDHILISKTCSPLILKIVTSLSQKMGISFALMDLSRPKKWKSHVNKKTKLVLVEALSCPSIQIPDLEILREFATKHSLLLVLDNSYCTPFLQTSSNFGVDCVIYSDSLYLDGQSRISGGIILGTSKAIAKIRNFSVESESGFSSFHAWVLGRGLETLAVRMERHSTNALRVAEYLEKNSVIEKVVYPFLASHSSHQVALKQMKFGGGILSFSMQGGVVRGRRFIECMKKFANPTDASIRTSVTHPASTTHSPLPESVRLQLGASSNLILLSVGLEHIDDILEEIETAICDSKIVFKLHKKGY